jgi:hypothetical protein
MSPDQIIEAADLLAERDEVFARIKMIDAAEQMRMSFAIRREWKGGDGQIYSSVDWDDCNEIKMTKAYRDLANRADRQTLASIDLKLRALGVELPANEAAAAAT